MTVDKARLFRYYLESLLSIKLCFSQHAGLLKLAKKLIDYRFISRANVFYNLRIGLNVIWSFSEIGDVIQDVNLLDHGINSLDVPKYTGRENKGYEVVRNRTHFFCRKAHKEGVKNATL